MPIGDNKKVQTMINRLATSMTLIRAQLVEMQAIRTLYTAAAPDPTGTPLAGNVATVGTALDSLQTEVDKAIWTQLIAAKVPSHSGGAL